jgi:large subunit ribosomal protein L32
MPVPKRKRSRARRDKRFANKGLAVKTFAQCSNCNEALSPHQACTTCGFYKGKKVIKTKLDRGLKRVELRKAQQAQAPTTAVESEESSSKA